MFYFLKLVRILAQVAVIYVFNVPYYYMYKSLITGDVVWVQKTESLLSFRD